MKVLHLSFHYGCISDVQDVLTRLGCEVTYQCMTNTLPYRVSAAAAEEVWQTNKDRYNAFDVVVTSDTVALSYVFLRHLDELTPHLVILNCNRFTYGMESETAFLELLRSSVRRLDKVTFVPYTDFERIWCGKHHLFLHERALPPVGNYATHIKDPEDTRLRFSTLDTARRTKPPHETFFVQRYDNHHTFMNLPAYLHDRGLSVDFGSYIDLDELTAYRAVVALPDQFSKYFTFESIHKRLVVVLPSQKFLMELVTQPRYYFSIAGSSGLLTPDFVNLCEWYKYPECRIYFDSFDHMIDILRTLSDERVATLRGWCEFYGNAIQEEHTLQWKHLLCKIEKHKA